MIAIMESIDISQSEEIFTVSRLNREVRFTLEGSFPLLWVEGEISNFAAPSSGHWYFSLKDHSAQVRCAMFKPNNRRLGFIPKDGMHVILKARVSLYEGRGEFQLLGEHMEEVGEGQLRLAFEALKNRLQGAGLFDPVHKKTLPLMPKTIGVITSPTGAAIRDILSVLRRRFTAAQVIIYPSMVQGATAAPTIVEAIKLANARNECDVLILARGGGSLEDLWPFNEEVVAHAIFASRLPVISGVGHEVDFTIADFVADVRAPTPSAAAELITPDQEELYSGLMHIQQRLLRYMRHKFQQLQQNLDWSAKNLQQQHPQRRLALQNEQLAIAKATLLRLQNQFITQSRAHLSTQQARLTGLTPAHRIRDLSQQLNLQFQGLKNHLGLKINKLSQRLGSVAAKLDALSPLATMQRGFAVATFGKKVLQTSDQVNVGDEINVRLVKGNLDCKVLEKN